MDIYSAMLALNKVQASLSITVPYEKKIEHVYFIMPGQDDPIASEPCWLNEWTLSQEKRDSNGVRRQDYEVKMVLVVEDWGNWEDAAKIATAFHVAMIDALDEHTTLYSTVAHHDLRGNRPSVAPFTWSGKKYAALMLFLDMHLVDAKEFRA